MSIHVALTHRTVYTYDRRVSLTPQVIRLRPAPHSRTRILSYALHISPQPHFINWQQDPHANWLARIVFPEKVDHFSVTVDLVADMAVYNPFDFFLEPDAEESPFAYGSDLAEELAPFRRVAEAGPKLAAFVASIDRTPRRTVDFLVDLNARLQREIRYLVRMEPGVQTPEETLTLGSGSCRDTAWLLVAILRHLGYAARFVSGYLIQLTPDQKPLEGPEGPTADFTDLHAWTEVYLPGAGWVGLDPTSGLFAGEGHIPLAATPDTPSAAPVSGGVEACETTFDFSMSVQRVLETPRVTKPYTEEQWQGIVELGHAVDARLNAADARLTMGGEPTFISIDDMDGPEWNTEAVGPDKERLALDLLHRLKARFAPDGLMVFGQGKWYPGEQLPRWAHALYWRADGQPLWRDRATLGDPATPGPHDPGDAGVFLAAVADALGVDREAVTPAYEDPWHYLGQESRLPFNVDPTDNRLKDPQTRERLARTFERGLDQLTGYILPVQRWNSPAHPARWLTEVWRFRQGRCYLIPGDSAMGMRLPLESLPWVPARFYPYMAPLDPFAPRGPLPPLAPARLTRQDRRTADRTRRPAGGLPGSDPRPAAVPVPEAEPSPEQEIERAQGGYGVVRTALCVEVRNGRLHAFMPPVEALEDYLDLLTAIEDTAAALDTRVTIEGYPPPHDPRLCVLKVTPDPGVIEVNVQPSASWDELVRVTETLYEEARACRLGTEKFMIDGRHVGTGGGNHLVVGGASPADSPFLRRPDLLGSLIRYWQVHPALSYLFSGLFIGPTSQAPRVDEARDDSLYELEIALDRLPTRGESLCGTIAPWVVDRVLRDVLTDVTGNTHRTEISIDKLYSPDGPTGRLGLVEFRGFEMPPHARMSLAQQLLLRALIARFWETPFQAPLVPWGQALRDRFMLPHFVAQDLRDVIDDMNRAGFPLRFEWFAPHIAFRFPTYGTVHHGGVDIEVRHALEPWHVMGEDPSAGGTVRFVDSSAERLQIRATGLVPGRHVLTCQGRRLPMTPTGTPGEAVAGVRYRAWWPSRCLHPTIAPHTPLVFDLLDTWNGRSLGGCMYHVAHPGGRSYDTTPVNANEAESRRLARFFAIGHSAGPLPVPPAEVNPDFPMTLDLRRRPGS
ncbi:transglutaminase family protein [Pararhodospirillum oryzae]|uniref:Transglutaminase n=1 Tax=Pararhodospirillum oryzae TaxID=478448 RepID=A0A512H4H1_9PROT|nr:transglutaminase family protein [Pararhodospirillum oryzae]GEO80366.1 transglutaminase [Pararhodospirillum oryzae]